MEEGDFPDFLACRDLEDFNTFRQILVQARHLLLRIEDSYEIPLSEIFPYEQRQSWYGVGDTDQDRVERVMVILTMTESRG